MVAFQGPSVVEAPHRLRLDARTLYTWSAWDTLFLPELLGRPAEIESSVSEWIIVVFSERLPIHLRGKETLWPPRLQVKPLISQKQGT